MNESSLKSPVWLRTLLSIEGIGPSKIISLISKYQTAESLAEASVASLCKINGINQNLGSKILHKIRNFKEMHLAFQSEYEITRDLGGRIVAYFDPEFPKVLKNIYFPPMILYVIGNIDENPSIAVVGTRNPSKYGRIQAERITRELVNQNLTIVSGLARGIDSIVHYTALRNSGRTVAVTGSGLDVIYPAENRRIYEEIPENGAIITEYPPGTKPDAQNFPRRNRIISGISMGTLLIETKKTGGAMLTARYALDQNREIFALPGNIDSAVSEGTNLLIQKGEAKLVTDIEDILLELRLKLKPEVGKNIPKTTADLNFFEEKIYGVLTTEPRQIDEISMESNISTADCLVHLLSLEFKGLIRQYPGKVFAKN